MSNLAILYEDQAQGGTYSGGSWVANLPLTNLKTADPKRMARSTNDSEASTQFVVDLGYPALIDIAALINHNLTDAAELRVRIGPNADGSAALIDETLTAGDFGSDAPAAGKAIFHLNPASVSARYVLWEISDESNPSGYVQFGRHFVGPAFQPAVNVVRGAQLSLIDDSRLSRAVSGAQYADLKPKRRRLSGAFDALTEDESFGEVYDLQKLCGLSVPMLAVYDPSFDGNALQRTAVYGVLTDIQPIVIAQVAASGDRSSWQFAIEERN